MSRLNHIELLLPGEDIEAAVRTFSDLLGLPIGPVEDLKGHGVLVAECEAASLEMIAPSSPDSPLQASLARKGRRGAIGPIVWQVPDLAEARRRAEAMGVRPLYEIENHGDPQLTFNPQDCYGYSVSFVQRDRARAPPAGAKPRINHLDRVELLLPTEDVAPALAFFGRLLDLHIPPPEYLAEHHVLTQICREANFEVFGPGDAESVLHASLERKGRRGAIGPIVWETSDMDRIVEAAKAQGHDILYQFNDGDRRQMSLSPEKLFGYTLTFTQPGGAI